MSDERFQSFAEFWPYYVGEHHRGATRWLHFFGTTLAVGVLAAAIIWQQWWALVAVPIIGYGPAWIGHFFIEKNRPATFKYPLWSFLADLKMWWLMLAGRMDREAQRVQDTHRRR